MLSSRIRTYIKAVKTPSSPISAFSSLTSERKPSMSLFTPAPEPSSPLARYRVLSPLAGVRVSPLQLGAMSIGDQWDKIGMGAMDKESSFKLLDAYYEAGGNFIDTANN